jgi:hypothetical protein
MICSPVRNNHRFIRWNLSGYLGVLVIIRELYDIQIIVAATLIIHAACTTLVTFFLSECHICHFPHAIMRADYNTTGGSNVDQR